MRERRLCAVEGAACGRRRPPPGAGGRFPGAPTTADGVDLGALVRQKDGLVEELRHAKYADVADAYGFDVRAGQACFLDADTLTVDGEPLRAGAHLIATGSEPSRPDLPGLEGIEWLTSTSAMELQELPASLVVIGGDYVGLEQAQLFADLGTRVTLVGRLAPQAEPELAQRLREVFTEDGITVIEEHAVESTADGVSVRTGSGRHAAGARVLVATGRHAQTDGLNLAGGNVRTDKRGFVLVDETQRTSNPRVYAAATSPAPRSTSTSPQRPAGWLPSTPSRSTTAQRRWTTAACPR